MCYIEKQYKRLKDIKSRYGGYRYDSIGRVLSDYKDYLNMADKLKYDFKNSISLFPKDLSEAHDLASKIQDFKKYSVFNKPIRDAYKNLSEKYCFSKDGLTLIPPKTAKELVNEGHALHHCVYSYAEKVAAGKCLIFFIRQTDNLKEPFYTLEVQDGCVTQVHGQYHCAPTQEVKSFLEIWTREKLGVA